MLRVSFACWIEQHSNVCFRSLGFTYTSEEERRRIRLVYAALIAVFLILLALLLLNFLPKLIWLEQTPSGARLAPLSASSSSSSSSRSPPHLSASSSSPRISLKGLYHYKQLSPSTPHAVQLITAPPASPKQRRLRLPVASLLLKTTTSLPATTTTLTLPPSTWLPSFPADLVCEPNQFKCPGEGGVSRRPCLWEWDRCDGIADCSDGSDEAFCQELNCYGNFQCGDGRCVSLAKACNGIPDCGDGSDELQCESFHCKPYELRCATGFCIPQDWRCDGDADCPGHEDEFNCSSSCTTAQFHCGEGWCIPYDWRCNGVSDCLSGEDELHCPLCRDTDFHCHSGGCVDAPRRCDGQRDCRDGSDEADCFRLTPSGLLEVQKGRVWTGVCGDLWDTPVSAVVCQALGRGSQGTHLIQPPPPAPHLLSLSSLRSTVPKVLAALQPQSSGSCRTGVVEVSCAEAKCGIWHPSQEKPTRRQRVKRIVGGFVSGSAQWPSVALLYHAGKAWACTASVLSSRWLVTSALCVSRTDLSVAGWHVVLGVAAPNATAPQDTAVTRRVAAFHRHPNYKFHTHIADFDLILLRLDQPVTLAGSIAAVCLPSAPPPPDAWCVTAGWGYTTPGGYFVNQQLRHLEMELSPELSRCNSSQHYAGFLSPRMLCASAAGGGTGQPCANDEGAPLLCLEPSGGRWQLAGLLSAHSCGSLRLHPAIYADVSSLRPWILATINS